MRKRIAALIACTAAAGAAVAGAASSSPVAYTPSSTKAPNELTIDINPSTLVPPNETPEQVALSLPKGTTFDATSRTKTCTPVQAGEEGCPPAAMVGFGHFVVHLTYPGLEGGQTDLLGYLEGYLGKPLNSGDPASISFEVELLGVDKIKAFLHQNFGLVIHTETGVAARIQKLSSGPYGLQISFAGIPGIQVPPVIGITMTRFKLQLGAVDLKKVTFFHNITVVGLNGPEHLRIKDHRLDLQYLLTDPSTCHGSWPFQVQVTFPDGVATNTYNNRCTTAPVPLIPPPTPAPSDRSG